MVPTCKNVAPYSPTSLNIETLLMLHRVTAFSYLFLYFLAMPSLHPYYFCRKLLLFLVSVYFYSV